MLLDTPSPFASRDGKQVYHGEDLILTRNEHVFAFRGGAALTAATRAARLDAACRAIERRHEEIGYCV